MHSRFHGSTKPSFPVPPSRTPGVCARRVYTFFTSLRPQVPETCAAGGHHCSFAARRLSTRLKVLHAANGAQHFLMPLLFPCYLRMVRKRWALTQRELAALLGATTREHISRLENCRAHPSAALLLSLEVVFGKAPHTLFPEFYDEIEDRVVRNLYRMQQELERGDADDVRQRTKHQLLAEALSRAVLRTKRPTDYDL